MGIFAVTGATEISAVWDSDKAVKLSLDDVMFETFAPNVLETVTDAELTKDDLIDS